LLDVYQPKELIKMMFDEKVSKHANEIINDIQIVNATKSQLSTLLAISFYSKAIFLVGDCAHSPNFGNFGLNIGLQDVHELVHTILFTERNPRVNK
jgi:2-polyprenyl-6-methoxyphenol hydroxylase-like FAD-dependent oxidoreductase